MKLPQPGLAEMLLSASTFLCPVPHTICGA
jgi:hypothetical protein